VRDDPYVVRVLADPVAKYLWMAVFAVGVVVGWLTNPWWAVASFPIGFVVGLAVVEVKARRGR